MRTPNFRKTVVGKVLVTLHPILRFFKIEHPVAITREKNVLSKEGGVAKNPVSRFEPFGIVFHLRPFQRKSSVHGKMARNVFVFFRLCDERYGVSLFAPHDVV